MPDGREAISVNILGTIGEISPAAWDACAGTANPFVSHAFLSALEDSGSAIAATGWQPVHLAVEADGGDLLACAPLYLKSHSYGEYVFDWGWAEAFERAGGAYYPKLQCAVPFTPATGPRLLVRTGLPADDADALRNALADAMPALAARTRASSVHATFLPESEQRVLAGRGWLPRLGCQYHWHNRGYRTFEDFLAALSSRKRKAIRKERAAVVDSGVTLKIVTGSDLAERHWDAFYQFYRDTSDRKWGGAYLTRAFFSLLGERMPGSIVLVLAEHDGRTVAGALNLLGGDTLYGRHWGCAEQFRFLHFEACYYQAIAFAIGRGVARVEAGAQGEHKIQRGYLPVPTYSAHWIANDGLRNAVARFLIQERRAMAAGMTELAEFSPFRADGERG